MSKLEHNPLSIRLLNDPRRCAFRDTSYKLICISDEKAIEYMTTMIMTNMRLILLLHQISTNL